jgi:hypothetical protein
MNKLIDTGAPAVCGERNIDMRGKFRVLAVIALSHEALPPELILGDYVRLNENASLVYLELI